MTKEHNAYIFDEKMKNDGMKVRVVTKNYFKTNIKLIYDHVVLLLLSIIMYLEEPQEFSVPLKNF